MPAPLPLTIIGGFLGAGKTTLLNRWLREAGGRRLAVLVNDFGAINIDAQLIESSDADVVALTNGCVCCRIGDDLTGALIRVLESPAPFDAVVVEASGVSDPWRIAQFGRADPALALDSVIVLVDAASALQQARDPLLSDTLERQLRSADLIVVNKADLTAPEQRARVHAWIASVAGRTPRFETIRSEVPMPLLNGLALAEAGGEARSADRHHHESASSCDDPAAHHLAPDHGELFDTWSCRPQRPLPEAALRAWIKEVPDGVLRLKGVLETDRGAWVEIQFAGRHGSVRRAAEPATEGAAIVAIGLRGRLPAARLDEFFLQAGDRTAEQESRSD